MSSATKRKELQTKLTAITKEARALSKLHEKLIVKAAKLLTEAPAFIVEDLIFDASVSVKDAVANVMPPPDAEEDI